MEQAHADSVSCGSNAQKKILVAYATRAQSTREVAEFIAQELCRQGLSADTQDVEAVKQLSGYRGVIVGSAIRMGSWVSEAKDFISDHKQELSKLPVAFFSVCLTLKDDTPENRAQVKVYTDAVKKEITPISEEFFAGKGDLSKLSFFSRMIAKMVKMPEGDFRNWEKIRVWTDETATKF